MDYQALQQRADELLAQGQYETLVDLYTEALGYGYPKSAEAELLSALAELYNHFGEKEKSKDHYASAIAIFRTLEGEGEEGAYFPVIAAVTNNLGILYEEENEDQAATEKFKESLEIYEKLAEKAPELYKPYVATTHYNLANLLGKKPDFYQSRKHLQQAYEIFKPLADADPINFDAYLANTLISLGNSYVEEHDYNNAEIYFEKALPVYRKLADIRFDIFGPYLAATLNNLAVASKETKQQDKAVLFYEETLDLYQRLAEENPEAFLPYKAATLNSMGILFSEMFDKDEALVYYNRAIEIYQRLASRAPVDFNPYLATSIHNLAILLDEKGELDQAEAAYHKALYLRDELAAQYPGAFDRDVCVTAMNLVTLYQQFLEKDQEPVFREKAKELLADVSRRLEKLNRDEPVVQSLWSDHEYFVDFFENVTTEALSIANVLRRCNALTEEINSTIDPAEKIIFQQQIIELLEAQKTEYPHHQPLTEELSTEYGNLSWLSIRLKDFKKARIYAEKGMELNPGAYWVKMNLYYLGMIDKAENEALSILDEIMTGCSTDLEKHKVREQMDMDIQKLRLYGLWG
ncbi:MAG: tetratricopeptide repeat protein [Saprospiraceae bacterium]|nr:tetratricopeptide repeat protein [Saprospiraceae bacterium]